MRRIAVFRADASACIGAGHISRCLALANHLAEGGWDCVFAVTQESLLAFPGLGQSAHRIVLVFAGADAGTVGAAVGEHSVLTVIDHYDLDASFETACRQWSDRILVIDDLADRRHDCDFLIDQTLARAPNDYAGLAPPACRLLLGPDYALLRPEFGRLRKQALERPRDTVHRIVVAIGGSDPLNITGLALQAIRGSGLDLKVDVVLGSVSPNFREVSIAVAEAGAGWQLHVDTLEIADLMSTADLAIGACGIGAWERCTLGLPTIAVVIADNQRMIARELNRRGAIVYAGDWHETSVATIKRHLREIAGDGAMLAAVAANAADVCDGRGLERVESALAA